jgi:hypothetical protein
MYSSVLYLVKHRFNLQPASEEDPSHLVVKSLMHLLRLKSSNISCSVYESCMVFFGEIELRASSSAGQMYGIGV